MSTVLESGSAAEARQFADTVATVVARHATPDPWQPGAAASDADPALDRALSEAGWDELGNDDRLLPFVAPAAAALGRGFASLEPVDRLLGGALRTGELARYAVDGGLLVEPRAGRLELARAGRVAAQPYTDALGVARVAAGAPRAVTGAEARTRMAAWAAGSTGYLAGMAEESLRLALGHARSRRAFGGTLDALEPVQQMLADAATLADGLRLLTEDVPGFSGSSRLGRLRTDDITEALAHAGEAAERAIAICMQVTGALGFTLEFPLQRAYRRGRAARSWADAVLLAWAEPAP